MYEIEMLQFSDSMNQKKGPFVQFILSPISSFIFLHQANSKRKDMLLSVETKHFPLIISKMFLRRKYTLVLCKIDLLNYFQLALKVQNLCCKFWILKILCFNTKFSILAIFHFILWHLPGAPISGTLRKPNTFFTLKIGSFSVEMFEHKC